jgi:hypothetical protein
MDRKQRPSNHFFVDYVADTTQGFSVNQDRVYQATILKHFWAIIHENHQVPQAFKSIRWVWDGNISALTWHMALANPITSIIKFCTPLGQFPNAWECAIVTPIFESADPLSICIFRPISIRPTASKADENRVAEHIISLLSNSCVPPPCAIWLCRQTLNKHSLLSLFRDTRFGWWFRLFFGQRKTLSTKKIFLSYPNWTALIVQGNVWNHTILTGLNQFP